MGNELNDKFKVIKIQNVKKQTNKQTKYAKKKDVSILTIEIV